MKITYISGIEAIVHLESGARTISKGDVLDVTEDEAEELLARPTFTIYEDPAPADDDSEEE